MDSALIDQTSEQFLGQWKRLVSTTNWEKGQIICQWREAMRQSDAPAVEYSDEAWSRRVGHVTPQHVGRLRRSFERFGSTREEYPGLYWSHFQAALDWNDAEMWLEGAVQSNWSISEMREKRHEALGRLADEEPSDVDAEIPWDEDAEADGSAEVVSGKIDNVRTPGGDDDFASDAEQDADALDESAIYSGSYADQQAISASQAVRPFAELPSLPADVSDAFEAFKLCILRHKLAGWEEIGPADLIASLEALKQLALQPADA